MNLKINNWFGRLGNNIRQVYNALVIATFYNYNIIIPKHTYFNTTYIVINDKINHHHKTIIDKHDFFYSNKISFTHTLQHSDFNTYNSTVVQYLKDIFIVQNTLTLDPDDLVIHLRGGDIFNNNPHNGYIQPPLSFYTNIINNNTFKDIHIVSEDTTNPCVNRLLQLFPNIKFKKQSLKDDINLILGAHNVICSYGTFVPSLLLLSTNIKHVHYVNYLSLSTLFSSTISCHIYDFANYHKQMSPWKNTTSQRNLMLEYKLNQ